MHGVKPRLLADRLWEKVDRSAECWEWTGYRDPHGYGRMGIHHRPVLVHRISWELTHGPIPEGLRVLHRCDNPPCVRPDHLFLGTQADNVRDMAAKGRGRNWGIPRIGEANRFAKLTEAKVLQIRSERANGATLKAIAAHVGVSLPTIWQVVSRTTWRHVP